MDYERDRAKAKANLKKHGVDFADAVIELEDELALTILDWGATEERLISLGVDAYGRPLVTVFTCAMRRHGSFRRARRR